MEHMDICFMDVDSFSFLAEGQSKYRKRVYGCFQKEGYPQIMNLHRIFQYKPSILGYTLFLETHI